MMDTSKLTEGLNKLTGLDFEQCEAQERTTGNNQPLITMTTSFQARLAAKALGVPAADVKELPLREYNKTCQTVFNFLFSTSGEAESER